MLALNIWKRGLVAGTALACIALAVPRGGLRDEKNLTSDGTEFLSGSTVPAPVRSILERACRDCHSENTAWPWYASVPPISWQIRSDVTRGRAFMNLSKWNEYGEDRRHGFALAMMTAANAGVMPPSKYTLLHRDARLSKEDLMTLRKWASDKETWRPKLTSKAVEQGGR